MNLTQLYNNNISKRESFRSADGTATSNTESIWKISLTKCSHDLFTQNVTFCLGLLFLVLG